MSAVQSLRDCNEWRKEKLPMNTCSNEAAKLYDASLTQLVIWREDDQFGGIESCLSKMLKADNEFVLGHVLKCGIDLIGTSGNLGKEYSKNIHQLTSLTDSISKNLTKRELNHVEAIKCLYDGNIDKSCDIWENILIEHPNDMLAIKFAHDSYFYLGFHAQMRDSIARVLPFWNSSMPLYSYMHGMHSFGLVQSNFFEQAKKSALKALELNANDGWATHSICHYNEYTNDFEFGIKFLRETESDWSVCNLISPHNYWHLCLYNIEKNEHEEALQIFDTEICKTLELDRTLDMVDLISLLFRLKLDGYPEEDLKERWIKLKQVFKSRISHHGFTFNDSHVLILLNACGDQTEKDEFFRSFDEYLNTEVEENQVKFFLDSCNNIVKNEKQGNYLKKINRTLGATLFSALNLFHQKEYSQVVDLLKPIRYNLIKIGGSNAQRDMFHQLLVHSALLSDLVEHQRYGLALINERMSLKPNSNLNKRICNKYSIKQF